MTTFNPDCKLCTTSLRHEIEQAVAAGVSEREIERRWLKPNGWSRTTLRTHTAKHAPMTAAMRDERKKAARTVRTLVTESLDDHKAPTFDGPDDVLARYTWLYDKAERHVLRTEKTGSAAAHGKAIGDAKALLDSIARVFGMLKDGSTVTNILDQSTKMLSIDPNVSDEFLRAFVEAAERGEKVPEFIEVDGRLCLPEGAK